jgi:hypothetical protein
MTELDRLPPDQRAVLSLVLDRGKSYAEVSAMLSIPEATVRERAHAALDAMARAGTARGAEPVPPTAPPTPPSQRSPQLPSSRLGGALLLGAIVVAAIVVAIVLSSGGKGSANNASRPGSTAPTTTGATGTAKIDNKLTLSPAEPESKAGGEAYVLSDGSRRAFYVAAQNLPPSQSHGFFYAVWLYNSPSSSAPLGRAPAVTSNGRLEGGGPLPSNAADYARLIVTRETSTRVHHPGPIVLSGRFSLG